MEEIELARRTISMLHSMVESGEYHTARSREMKDNAMEALNQVKNCSIQNVSVSSFVDSIADNTTYINGKHYSNEFKKLTVPVIEYNILKKLAKDYDNSNSR